MARMIVDQSGNLVNATVRGPRPPGFRGGTSKAQPVQPKRARPTGFKGGSSRIATPSTRGTSSVGYGETGKRMVSAAKRSASLPTSFNITPSTTSHARSAPVTSYNSSPSKRAASAAVNVARSVRHVPLASSTPPVPRETAGGGGLMAKIRSVLTANRGRNQAAAIARSQREGRKG